MACECQIAAQFALGSQGIISANLKVGTNVNVTEGGIVLLGPSMGSLSISAYTMTGESLACPGRAGTSFEWMQKLSCDPILKVYMIPNGRAKAYEEGDVPTTMKNAGCQYQTFSASAGSGPHTPTLIYDHQDGYDLEYGGTPIQVGPANGKGPTNVSFLNSILPAGSELYMTSFSWEHTPPNIPVVNYSFNFVYNCNN